MGYALYSPLILVLAGTTAALIVWLLPGTDDRIGFGFAIASAVLALASIVLSLWRASS